MPKLIGGFVLVESKHSEKTLAYMRDYARKHRLPLNGTTMVVEKRPRPDNCEVCGCTPKRLDYHHWDDNHPELGIWVCKTCHDMCEGIEKGLDKRYLIVKQSILDLQVIE